jgi:hypothetical protein
MPLNMRVKPLIFIAVGFGLYWVARDVELLGDAAPFVPNGVSAERAKYHILALVLMLGALGFFIAGFVSIVRGWRR